MVRIFKSEPFLFIILSLVLLAAAFSSQIYTLFKTPPHRINLLVHNYYADYNIYLSEIAQGQNKQIFIINKFTSEPHSKILLRPVLSLTGFLISPLNLPPQIIYHLLRLFSSLLLFLTAYYFLLLFLKTKKQRLFAFFLSFASASFPKILFRQNIEVYTFFNWWTATSLPARISFLPHHTFTNALLITIMILFYKGFKTEKTSLFILTGLISSFIALSAPVCSLLALFFLFTYHLYLLFSKKTTLPKAVIQISSFFLLSLPSLVYIYSLHQLSPWREINNWVTNQYYNVQIVEYLLSLGPVAILGLMGVLVFLKSKKNNLFFPFVFLFCFFTLLIISSLFSKIINPIRLIEAPSFIFFGLFSVHLLKKIRPKIPPIFSLIFFTTIIISLPAYKIELLDPLIKTNFSPWNYFPPKKLYQGLAFLKKNTNPEQITLSLPNLGNMIPAYSGNTVYLGHPVSTLNYEQKLKKTLNFYQGNLTSIQAKKFLKENNIKYTLFSYEEKPLSSTVYPFLKPIFTNSEISIFTLK